MLREPRLRIKTVFAAWLTQCLVIGCQPLEVNQAADVSANLPNAAEIAAKFEAFKLENPGCKITDRDARRVIVSGFWYSDGENSSGVTALGLQREDLFPSKISLNREFFESKDLPKFESLKVFGGVTKNGGHIRQRTLDVDGERFSICSIVLDVTWDLAPAIVLREIMQFNPHIVFMSGHGYKATFETIGINNAAMDGLGPTGQSDITNSPYQIPDPNDYSVMSARVPILPGFSKTDIAKANWDAALLKRRTQNWFDLMVPPMPKGAGHPDWLEYEKQIRTLYVGDGDESDKGWLCNGMLYTVGKALSGNEVRLANDRIKFPPLRTHAKFGFFHYPSWAADSAQSVRGWGLFLIESFRTLSD